MATMASTEMTSDTDNPEKLQDRLKVSWPRRQAISVLMILWHSKFWWNDVGSFYFYCDQECTKGKRGKAS
jgi:hypothetical protein